MHRFDDQQATSWLQRLKDMTKHGLVFGHFMIGVVNQRRVEPFDRKMRVIDSAEDRLDVSCLRTRGAFAQFRQI